MFSATYVPMQAPGAKDPSKSGFATREEAEAYAKSHYCQACLEDEAAGETSGCGCEWEIEEED
jgi:hypothetical protein